VIPDRPRLTTDDTGVGAQKAPVNAAGAIHTTVRQVNRGQTGPQIPHPAAPDRPFRYAMDRRGSLSRIGDDVRRARGGPGPSFPLSATFA